MIEVRVRHEHQVELGELVGRERALHQPQRAEAADAKVDADAGEEHRVGEDAHPVEVDEDGGVAEPRQRDGVVVTR